LSHFNGCWKTFIADLWVLSHIIVELDCLSKARSFTQMSFIYSFTQTPWVGRSSNALLAKSKAKAGNQRVAILPVGKIASIYTPKDSFSKQITCLGFKIVFAYKIFIIENCRQIRKIMHFESFCILQLKSLLIALQSLPGGPCKHNI
jgi:hypothetical protein